MINLVGDKLILLKIAKTQNCPNTIVNAKIDHLKLLGNAEKLISR